MFFFYRKWANVLALFQYLDNNLILCFNLVQFYIYSSITAFFFIVLIIVNYCGAVFSTA